MFKRHPQPQQYPEPPKKKSFPYVLLAVCVFCVWLVQHSISPTLPKHADPPRLYANPSREDLRLTLLKAIREAHSSIHLAMFGLSDPSILTALSEKIQQNLPTKVYYDPTGSPNVRKALRGADIHPIHQSGFMHQKILILDDQTVFLGSANFTTKSLKMHDNLVIGLVSRKIAHFLKQKIPSSTGHLRTMVGGQDVEIWLLPDPKGHALADLKKQIRTATRSLRIAIFTLTHKGLIDEVIRAHKRGVAVTVVIDLHSALGASARALAALQTAGIRVLYSQGAQLLHHKFVYIDEQTLVTGSANWTHSAFAKNSDSVIILHNLNKDQRTFLNRLWRRIETSAKKKR